MEDEKINAPADAGENEIDVSNTNNQQPDSEIISEKHPVSAIKPLVIFAAIVNGLGVGLLLGLLLGLAISEVVSGVIGTLSSLLLILLGLNDKYMTVIKGIRIGSFGIFTVAGIVAGIYIRTHDALSPTTIELREEYIEAGYTKDQALYYVARTVFEYVPVGWFGTSLADTGSFAGKKSSHKSLLFSSEVDLSECDFLISAKSTWPKSEVINSFESAGGTWEELVVNLEPELPDQVFIDALLAIRDSFCGLSHSGELKIESSADVVNLNSQDNLDKIINTLSNSGDSWKTVVENTSLVVPLENQKTFYLTLIKTFKDEKRN